MTPFKRILVWIAHDGDLFRSFLSTVTDPFPFLQHNLAKSFVLMGMEAGFDMESPEGMHAWVEAYNATVAPTMAAASRHPGLLAKKKSRTALKGTMNAQRRKKKRIPPQ